MLKYVWNPGGGFNLSKVPGTVINRHALGCQSCLDRPTELSDSTYMTLKGERAYLLLIVQIWHFCLSPFFGDGVLLSHPDWSVVA